MSMDQLTKYEKGVLEKILFRVCSNKIHDTEHLKMIETIYKKLFDKDIKDGYNKWVELNKTLFK